MMELQLSWDVVFVALLIVVFGVAFIRPHKFTLRLLLGTYLALIITEGGSFFLEKTILPAAPALQNWVSENGIFFFMSIRLIIFLFAIILFLVCGHYHIVHKKRDHWLARAILHFIFAVLTSILICASIFTFLSGNSLIDTLLGTLMPNPWFDESLIVAPMLHLLGIWIASPAIGMLVASAVGSPKE